MKKRLLSIIFIAVMVVTVLSFTGCSLFGGGSGSDGGGTPNPPDDGGGKIATENLKLTGEIPFDLEEDFYIQLDVKSVADALNPVVYSFIAVKKGDVVYACYSLLKYNDASDYANGIDKECYIEERILENGVDYRKSSLLYKDGGYQYNENWNTKVSAGTTMTTTIEYIQNFLNGTHVADTPFNGNQPITNKPKISSTMSTSILKTVSAVTSGVDMYADGAENLTFASDEEDFPNYTPDSKQVNKYKGVQYGSEDMTTLFNVKTWGNLVVYAEQANGSNVLKKTIRCKFSSTVSETAVEDALGLVGGSLPSAS